MPKGWVGRTAVAPAPPASARTLTAEIGDESFTVELEADGSSGVVR
jgi:hypothetical protein